MASVGTALIDSRDTTSSGAAPLSTRDKVTLVIIAFYVVIAVTFEGYWLVFNQVMEQRHDVFAKALSVYWPVDYTYRVSGYPIEKCFTMSVESLNVLVWQPLSLLLAYAIVKRRVWRYPLQLLVSIPPFYGTVLYYYVAHLSGYAVFAHKDAGAYALFYLINAPWFVGYVFLVYDATRETLRRLARAPSLS
jgi:hypothetical protein